MADDELRTAIMNLLYWQKEAARSTAALATHELIHKDAAERHHVYLFPTVMMDETIDTCMEVLTHWIDVDPVKPKTVAFNSPGGGVFSGFALYDFIVDAVESGITINTSAYGKCASMAAVVLQAGKERSLHRNAMFMVHEVDTFIQGTAQSLKDQLDFTMSLQDRIERVLVGRTNLGEVTQEELHEKTMHRDWWLTPEDALRIGFIDTIATR